MHSALAALDVTAGPGPDDFVMLGADQSIRAVTPRLFGEEHVWLAPPASPVWSGALRAEPQVIRSQLDASGWLVALRGKKGSVNGQGPVTPEGR